MIKKVEKRVVEQEIYVASDGKEFYSERECRRHERRLLIRAAENTVESLPQFSAEFRPSVLYDYALEWRWYFVSTVEELEAIKTALYDGNAYVIEDLQPDIPCWIFCKFNDEEGSARIEGTLKNLVEKMDRFKSEILEMVNKYEEERK